MKRLKLALGDLEVESFAVLPDGAGRRGTVRAHSGDTDPGALQTPGPDRVPAGMAGESTAGPECTVWNTWEVDFSCGQPTCPGSCTTCTCPPGLTCDYCAHTDAAA